MEILIASIFADPVTSLRKKLDQSIESPKSLVTNARCLTEEIDVKEIDGVSFE